MNIKPDNARQGGSVILEALIAILIFSIGILALVGLQATAINSVADAKYRSTAGFLANQIVGTIWATRVPAAVAISNVVIATPDANFACDPCDDTNGNAYTRAWVASGVAELPNGRASIAISSNVVVTVTLRWQPPNAANTHQHVVATVID